MSETAPGARASAVFATTSPPSPYAAASKQPSRPPLRAVGPSESSRATFSNGTPLSSMPFARSILSFSSVLSASEASSAEVAAISLTSRQSGFHFELSAFQASSTWSLLSAAHLSTAASLKSAAYFAKQSR